MAMTKKAQHEAQVEANKQVAYVKKVRSLVGFITDRIDNVSILAAYADGISADDHATAIASKSVVGAAIHPLKIDAVARARQLAEKRVATVLADLEAHGMDLQKAAPRADWRRLHTAEAKEQNAKNALYSRLTKPVGTGYRREGDPDLREANPEGIDRFVASNEADAAMQYDMFICKMVSKVGDVLAATIDGSHVWGYSFLTVVTQSGKKQVWKTQQIVNVSSLGNYFNQWPTRLLK